MAWVITAIHEQTKLQDLKAGDWFQHNPYIGGYAVQYAGDFLFYHIVDMGGQESVVPMMYRHAAGPLEAECDVRWFRVTVGWVP